MRTDISVANDFSKSPFGRFPRHSQWCGENFRKRLLEPALLHPEQECVTVFLDGIEGEYGSSFLEESFGGLIRNGMDAERVWRLLRIVTAREDWKEEVVRHISEASR